MKFILYLFSFFFLSTPICAQKSVNVIYVDFSATKNLNKLSEEVFEIAKKAEGDVLLFLSNDKYPIIIKDKNEIKNALNEISSLRPSKPDFFDEADTINTILSTEKLLSNFLKKEESGAIGEIVNFFFFLNAEQSNLYRQDKYFVNRILLSNRLLNKAGLSRRSTVNLYFNSSDAPSEQTYISNLKSKKLYNIYEY